MESPEGEKIPQNYTENFDLKIYTHVLLPCIYDGKKYGLLDGVSRSPSDFIVENL